jgi:hypothetical protein
MMSDWIGLGYAVSLGAKAVAVAAMALLGATACTAAKPVPYSPPAQLTTPAGSPAAPASPLPTAHESPLPSASAQLTGIQLQTVLLPQQDFPGGFAVSSASVVTSGGSLISAPARYRLAAMSCASFVQHLGNTGFGETAMAFDSVVGQEQAFDQVIYQFGSDAAAAGFLSGIRSLAARCRSFTAVDNGASGTLSMRAQTAAPIGGHPSLLVRQSGKLGSTPITLDTLWAASGVDVFGAAAIGAGTSVPGNPAKQAIVYALMTRQAAAAVLAH